MSKTTITETIQLTHPDDAAALLEWKDAFVADGFLRKNSSAVPSEIDGTTEDSFGIAINFDVATGQVTLRIKLGPRNQRADPKLNCVVFTSVHGGDVLDSIQRFTDTIICIPGVGSVSRLVNIIGPPGSVRRARQLIEELLEDIAADREIRRLSEPVKKQIAVPREALGVLIGKNGDNVKAMRLETNTMIICPRRWEPNVIEIFGTPQNVLAAEEVIRECIEYALYMNQRETSGQPLLRNTPPPGFETTQREKVASMVARSRNSCGSRTPQSQRSTSTATSSVGVQADLKEPQSWTKASESDDIISVAHYDEPLIDMNFTKHADEYFKEAIRRLLEDEDHPRSSTVSTPNSTTVSDVYHEPAIRQRQATANTTTSDDSPTRSGPPGFVDEEARPADEISVAHGAAEDSNCTSVGLEDGGESDTTEQTCAANERKRRKKKKKRGLLLNGKNFAENIEILMTFFPSDMRHHVFRALSGIAIVFFAVLFYAHLD